MRSASLLESLKYAAASPPVETAVAVPPNRRDAMMRPGPAGVKIAAAAAIPVMPLTSPVALPASPVACLFRTFLSRLSATSSANRSENRSMRRTRS